MGMFPPWKIFLLVLTILSIATKTWSDCFRSEDYNSDETYNYYNGQKFSCNNMVREQYQDSIHTIFDEYVVRKLELFQINLTTIDKQLFNIRYEEVYQLNIHQCEINTIEKDSFDYCTNLRYLYILGNNIKHFDGEFLNPLTELLLLDLTYNNIQQLNMNCNNNHDFTVLILNNNSLISLQENTFSSCSYLKRVEIGNNNIKLIRQNTFNNFNNLEYLNLHNNSLENLNFIKRLHNLSHLNLNGNKITSLPSNIFNETNELIHLDLSSNHLESIEPGGFMGLVKVHTILLQNNNISSLETKTFDALHNLKHLNLSSNILESIEPGAFIGLSSVETLDTKYIFKKINKIKANHFKGLSSLITLDLSDLNIQSIEPGGFNGLDNVRTILLQHNNITSLETKTFDGLHNLKHLNLSSNILESIEPGAFTGLSSVEILDTKYIFQKINKIKTDHFKGLSSLITLDLSDLNIQSIEPGGFKGLDKVRTILLQNINITSTFPCDIFVKSNVTSELNLSNNRMENISICVFQNLFSLKTLHLQFNQLSYLKVGTFSALSQLQYLDMSHNKLSALSEPVMHPLDSIEVLDISANYFTHLNPAAIFSHLTTLKQIDLSGNQWSCQNLTLIRKYFRSRGVTYNSKIQNFRVENIGGIECNTEEITDATNTEMNEESINNFSNKSNESIIIEILKYSYSMNNKTIDTFNNISHTFNNISHIFNNISRTYSSKSNSEKKFDVLLNEIQKSNKILSKFINNTTHDDKNALHETQNKIPTASTLEINSINNIYNLILILCTVYLCYKIIRFSYNIYKNKYARKHTLQKSQSTRTDIELLNNTDAD